MKNSRIFLSENFPFLIVKFSKYLNRRVFVMYESEFEGFKFAWFSGCCYFGYLRRVFDIIKP